MSRAGVITLVWGVGLYCYIIANANPATEEKKADQLIVTTRALRRFLKDGVGLLLRNIDFGK